MQAAGCADGIIKLWDVPGKRSLRKLVGHTGMSFHMSHHTGPVNAYGCASMIGSPSAYPVPWRAMKRYTAT